MTIPKVKYLKCLENVKYRVSTSSAKEDLL